MYAGTTLIRNVSAETESPRPEGVRSRPGRKFYAGAVIMGDDSASTKTFSEHYGTQIVIRTRIRHRPYLFPGYLRLRSPLLPPPLDPQPPPALSTCAFRLLTPPAPPTRPASAAASASTPPPPRDPPSPASASALGWPCTLDAQPPLALPYSVADPPRGSDTVTDSESQSEHRGEAASNYITNKLEHTDTRAIY